MLSTFLRRRGLLANSQGRQIGGLFFSSSASDSATVDVESASPSPNFMAEYLVSACGLSSAEASRACKGLAHLKSITKPESVVGLFRSHGFERSDLRKVVFCNPRVLCCDPEKNLGPKLQSLRDMGFSESEVVKLVVSNRCVLTLSLHRSILPRLELWTKLFGSRELLVKYFSKNQWFIGLNVEKKILPNLSFLKEECGIALDKISFVVKGHPNFIYQDLDSLRALVSQAEEYGVPRQSGMFVWALYVLYSTSRSNFEAKVKLLMSLGWSETEFFSAFKKAPKFLSVSREMLQKKMEFLVNVAGFTPSYVAQHPFLLMTSLQKRLIPRYRVMEMLKSKGLHSGKYSLCCLMTFSDRQFINTYVLRFKDKVPEIHDIFVAC